jgi:integrase
MASAKLTNRVATSASPREKEYTLWDTDVFGFGLRVHSSGRKNFVYKFRPGGGRNAPQRKITIGDWGPLTVEQARNEAKRLAGEIASGRDPATERDQQRTARLAERRAQTVAEFGETFLEDVRARTKPSTAKEYERIWTADILPVLSKMKVAEVTTPHVARLHRSMKDRPFLANRALAILGRFFTFAEGEAITGVHANPANAKTNNNRRVIPFFEEPKRERFLTPAEINRLGESLSLAASEGLPPDPSRRRPRKSGATAKHRPKTADQPKPANPLAVAAIRFLALTGWREREGLSLRWESVDDAQRSVVLEDTKTGRSARKLSAAARALLASVPRVDDSPWVFPGSDPTKPLVEINRTWYAVRRHAGLQDVRLHDLRHSLASLGASRGHSLLAIGKMLGHTDAATTQRYAHLWDDPIQAAADDIGDEVAQLLGLGAHGDDVEHRRRGRDRPSSSTPRAGRLRDVGKESRTRRRGQRV